MSLVVKDFLTYHEGHLGMREGLKRDIL